MRAAFLILVLIFPALSACGQRGSLYLPEEPAQQQVPEQGEGPGETEDERERRQAKDDRSDGD